MVEGPDGVGKSRFSEALAMAGHARYRHYGVPMLPTWRGEFGLDIVQDSLQGIDAVHDRSMFGNMIWPQLMGTRSLVNATNLLEIVDFLQHYSVATVLIMTRPNDDIVATLQERGESDEQIATALKSVPMYDGLARLLPRVGVTVRMVDSDDVHDTDVEGWWS
jgi:broad-specificity NMP kinase